MAVEDDGGFVLNVAHAEAARRRIERTAAYLHQGRAYASISDEELILIWITAMREWARAPADRPLVVDDAEAEFVLRDQEPPYARVRDEIGRLAACAMARIARMKEAERSAEGERILRRYHDERALRN